MLLPIHFRFKYLQAKFPSSHIVRFRYAVLNRFHTHTEKNIHWEFLFANDTISFYFFLSLYLFSDYRFIFVGYNFVHFLWEGEGGFPLVQGLIASIKPRFMIWASKVFTNSAINCQMGYSVLPLKNGSTYWRAIAQIKQIRFDQNILRILEWVTKRHIIKQAKKKQF